MKTMNSNSLIDHLQSKQQITSPKTNDVNDVVRKSKRLVSNIPVSSRRNTKSLTSYPTSTTKQTEAHNVTSDVFDKTNSLQLQMAVNFLNKTQMIRSLLEADLLACDMKWTLFLVAALSYRYDMKLIPIPPRYIDKDNRCNVNALVAVINETPKLTVILQNILDKNYEEIDVDVIELLYWVLVEMRYPHLLRISCHDSEMLLRQMIRNMRLPIYTHVFEVVDYKGSHSTEEFYHRLDNGSLMTRFGFIGDNADNFYIMLNCGIASRPGSNSQVTVYNDLDACVKETAISAGWGASECGPVILCTALCEYAVTPDLLEAEKAAKEKRLYPLKTVTVDGNMVRIRYVLVCDVKRAQHKKSKRRLFSWFRRYRYCISLVAYTIILASIGVANCNNCELIGFLSNRKFQGLVDIFKRMILS